MKMKTLIVSVLLSTMSTVGLVAQNNNLKVCCGSSVERIENFESSHVTSRNVDIWLPKDYNPEQKYAVLYMHDGQMLFDSTATWNKQEWMVDEIASAMMEANTVEDFIVVAPWNGGPTRHIDYFPQKPFESLSKKQKKNAIKQLNESGHNITDFQAVSDNYLRFLVDELKPYIDAHYSVHTDAAHTYVAGSSMGGLISMYAICEYPNVFSGAACLSTHWPGTFTVENNPIPEAFAKYMKHHLPNPQNHKIYFDHGDQTLDALYPALQKRIDEVMIDAGYTSDSWITKYFPGTDHSERAWNRRLHIPLEFIMNAPEQ